MMKYSFQKSVLIFSFRIFSDQTTTVTKNEVSEEKTIKEAIESDFRKFSIDLVNKVGNFRQIK